MTKPQLVIKREVDAKPDVVFAAWCQPKLLMRWSFPFQDWKSTTENDFKIGGQYTHIVTASDGTLHKHSGKYLDIVPNRKIIFTWNVLDMQDTLITVEFNEIEGKTQITLTHENFPDAELRTLYYESWQCCLNHLEEFLSNEKSK
jgi:uncharacterized protein YndB with AHSA1/START domain